MKRNNKSKSIRPKQTRAAKKEKKKYFRGGMVK